MKIRNIQKQQQNIVSSYLDFPKEENGVIYVRQSSMVQMQNNIHSFEMQTEKFEEHFRNNIGCTGQITIIADDEAMSGTLDIHARPGMSRMIKLIETNQVGWVAAVHVNRFTRDRWLITPGVLMKTCYEHNVWIATLRMNFNFKDDYCQRVFMLEAEESARHLEWMKLVLGGGRKTASSNGYYDGRWLVPGYIVDRTDEKRKKYIVYEPHAKVVKWLFRRFLELDGVLQDLCREVEKMPFLFPAFESWVDQKSISRFTGNRKRGGSLIKDGPYEGNYKSTATGIRSILCNPVYIGWWLPYDGGGVIENNHEPIVEEVLFTYAHKRLSSHDLYGQRQKPARASLSGEAEHILKKVIRDDQDRLMYLTAGREKLNYRSNETNGLSLKQRFQVSAKRIDDAFIEKLFERLDALERIEDWEDKIEERIEAKNLSHEHNTKLIQKQINDAQRQRSERMDTLHDPEIPKTKQMKIDIAEQIAGLEGKISQFQKDLEALEGSEEDEEVTLYQIHSLLPDIAAKWNKLSFKVRLRFVSALVQKVVLTEVAPHWLKIEIYWKGAIGGIDVGHIRKTFTNGSDWSKEEEELLYDVYAKGADVTEILEAIPNRSWRSIVHRASRLGLKRNRDKKHNSVFVNREDPGTLEDRKYEQENDISPNTKNVQWSPT